MLPVFTLTNFPILMHLSLFFSSILKLFPKLQNLIHFFCHYPTIPSASPIFRRHPSNYQHMSPIPMHPSFVLQSPPHTTLQLFILWSNSTQTSIPFGEYYFMNHFASFMAFLHCIFHVCVDCITTFCSYFVLKKFLTHFFLIISYVSDFRMDFVSVFSSFYQPLITYFAFCIHIIIFTLFSYHSCSICLGF